MLTVDHAVMVLTPSGMETVTKTVLMTPGSVMVEMDVTPGSVVVVVVVEVTSVVSVILSVVVVVVVTVFVSVLLSMELEDSGSPMHFSLSSPCVIVSSAERVGEISRRTFLQHHTLPPHVLQAQ